MLALGALLLGACAGARPAQSGEPLPACEVRAFLGEAEPRALAADGEGGLVAAGDFRGRLQLLDAAATSAGERDAFIARLGAGGSVRWLRALGGAGDERLSALALDSGGDVAVSGTSDRHCFVARLGPDGSTRWQVRIESSGESHCNAVAFDARGDVWTAGSFTGALPGAASKGLSDIFVAKLAGATGAVELSRAIGGKGNDLARALAVLPSGGAIVGGQFGGAWDKDESQVDFGRGAVLSAGDSDAFVLALDESGRTRWAATFGENGDDSVQALAAGPGGEVYAAGQLQPAADYKDRAPGDAGNQTGFVARFDAAGRREWLQRFEGPSSHVAALALDAAGRLWAAGSFSGSLRAAGATLVSAGKSDGLALALAPDALGTAVSARSFGGPESDGLRAAARVPGGVAFAGVTRGELDVCGKPVGTSGEVTAFLLTLRGQ